VETLIAEDLLLLLLDDEKGTTPGMWVDVRVPLGAAVLAELALEGAVELERRRAGGVRRRSPPPPVRSRTTCWWRPARWWRRSRARLRTSPHASATG
jgi:hypothetical protein